MQSRCLGIVCLGGLLGLAPLAPADEVTLISIRDNTMLDEDDFGERSNGEGEYMFAGNTGIGQHRRALVRFSSVGIPLGSTINSVTLTLDMSRAAAATSYPVRIHRVRADWGEGASNGIGDEGAGAAALPGDATWIHRFYPDVPWLDGGGAPALGGYFVASPSATTNVGDVGVYTWSGAGLVADVQAWVSATAPNFGWILVGNETVDRTAKRFGTRESPLPARRPRLTVNFTPPGGRVQGDLNCDGAVNVMDSGPFCLALTDPAQYAIAFPGCNRMLADLNGDLAINSQDALLACELGFNAPCLFPGCAARGDMNCDGAVNALDSDAFCLAFTNPVQYQQVHPGCDPMLADLNGNGTVETADAVLACAMGFEAPCLEELCAPDCPCDWDVSGAVDSSDFFLFLGDFFDGDADIDRSGQTDSSDFFSFLGCFFGGCPAV